MVFVFSDAFIQTDGVLDPIEQRNDPRIILPRNVRTPPRAITTIRNEPVKTSRPAWEQPAFSRNREFPSRTAHDHA